MVRWLYSSLCRALVGVDTEGFSHATQNRRTVVSLVNAVATSGNAFLRALVSILAVVTFFHVILYSPATRASESPIRIYRISLPSWVWMS